MKIETQKENPGRKIVEQACKDRNVNIDDVDKVLRLYGSELSEESIERYTQEFPKAVVDLASGLLIGVV